MAGNLNSLAAPTDAGSAMYKLADIYNRLNTNTQATKRAGAFTEPSAAPGSTVYTLDQVYEKAIPTQVPKTGLTTSYRTHDDGDLEKGVAWPSTRFTDNNNGTVTDHLTGLIWLKNANCAEATKNWNTAIDYSAALYDGCINCFGTAGDCGLSDSSTAGQWRLPNLRELQSLIDYSKSYPVLPSDNHFTGVQSNSYWSSSTDAATTVNAWYVSLYHGAVIPVGKTTTNYVWPVRGGQ
jgi:hypothetical protein